MDFKLSHSLSTKQLFKQTSLFVLFPFFLNSNQNWWDCPPSDPLFSNVCLFSQFFCISFCICFVQNLSHRPSIVPLRFILLARTVFRAEKTNGERAWEESQASSLSLSSSTLSSLLLSRHVHVHQRGLSNYQIWRNQNKNLINSDFNLSQPWKNKVYFW